MYKAARKILIEMKSNPGLTVNNLNVIFRTSTIKVEETVSYLLKAGYLQVEPNYFAVHHVTDNSVAVDTPLTITVEGKVALEDDSDFVLYRRFNEIRAWITVVIAVAAFIKSFFF
jgi:hypothetical protein